MSIFPAVAASYLTRSHRAARFAKWTVLVLLVSATAANGWFVVAYAQAASADRSAAAAVTLTQTSSRQALEEVVTEEQRASDAEAELRQQISFSANYMTIQGLAAAHETYVSAWETAKLDAATASSNASAAFLKAIDAKVLVGASGERAVHVAVISLIVVLIGSAVWFALSMGAAKSEAMFSLLRNPTSG